MAACAATHGAYSAVNTRKLAAAAGENAPGSAAVRSPPSSTPSVDSTVSLASSPVMSAVAARQSPKPSGANTGASACPATASRLSPALAATRHVGVNVRSTHTPTLAARMTVNARARNSFVRTHIRRSTLRASGQR